MSPTHTTAGTEFFYRQLEGVAADMWHQFQQIKENPVINRTDEGSYVENIVVDLLRMYLPKKLSIGVGYIMNEKGATSLQQDIVVYDASNYVLLQDNEGFQVFPVESVFATIEVKSTLTKAVLKTANDNVRTIKALSGTRLKVHSDTGEVASVEQYGAVIFSSVFAFRSNSSLETCTNNFIATTDSIDFMCILEKGVVLCTEDERQLDEQLAVVNTTTTRSRDSEGYAFLSPKAKGVSALPLALFLEHIVSHAEKHANSRGRYSMYNYLRIPPSTYELYRCKNPQKPGT